MSDSQLNAVVIGAGIVGICTAFELSKSGYNVTVIERFPLAAQFCSMGNAGVIRDQFAQPLKKATPEYKPTSLMSEAFKSLLPTFKPNYKTHALIDPYFFTDITSYKWGYAFFKSQFKRQNQDLLDIFNSFCHSAFIANATEVKQSVNYDFLSTKGYADIYAPLKSIRKIKNPKNLYPGVPHIQSRQIDSHVITQSDIHNVDIEITDSTFVGDCHKFANIISHQLSNGTMNDITFQFNTEATQILVKDKNVFGVEIDDNTIIKADKIVICAGVLTNNIVQNKVYQINGQMERKKLKMPYIPIVPLQGFTISVPYANGKYKYPFGSMVYFPSHIYVCRVNDNILRFSNYGYFRSIRYATKKWDGLQDKIESREGIQDNIYDQTKTEHLLLDNFENCIKDNLLSVYDIDEKFFNENKIRWTGFRPYSPDTLPIVDQIKNINGLYINAGHGMTGWRMGHGTAKLLVHLMNKTADETQDKVLKQLLSLDRF